MSFEQNLKVQSFKLLLVVYSSRRLVDYTLYGKGCEQALRLALNLVLSF